MDKEQIIVQKVVVDQYGKVSVQGQYTCEATPVTSSSTLQVVGGVKPKSNMLGNLILCGVLLAMVIGVTIFTIKLSRR